MSVQVGIPGIKRSIALRRQLACKHREHYAIFEDSLADHGQQIIPSRRHGTVLKDILLNDESHTRTT